MYRPHWRIRAGRVCIHPVHYGCARFEQGYLDVAAAVSAESTIRVQSWADTCWVHTQNGSDDGLYAVSLVHSSQFSAFGLKRLFHQCVQDVRSSWKVDADSRV